MHHSFDFAFQVVALVNHVGHFVGQGFALRAVQFMEDAENLVGIDGAEGKVVVGVTAVIEVEAASRPVWRSQATICSIFCAL